MCPISSHFRSISTWISTPLKGSGLLPRLMSDCYVCSVPHNLSPGVPFGSDSAASLTPSAPPPDSSAIQSGCKCCGVTATRELDVQLTCQTGRNIYHTFTVPDGCACSKCDSSSSELEGSSTAGAFWQETTGEDWTQQTTGGAAADPWATGVGDDLWATRRADDPWATGRADDRWATGGAVDRWATGGTGESARVVQPGGGGGLTDSELFGDLFREGNQRDIGTGPIH